MSRFLDVLRSGRVLLMDGAMGTELQRAGLKPGESGEFWNLRRPDRVLGIHQSYRDAGAVVFLTNTFQAIHAAIGARSRLSQASPKLHDERASLLALQWSAYVLARAAGGPEAFVLADVGSYVNEDTGEEFSDFSTLSAAAKRLGDVDGVLLETCSTERVQWAVRRIRKFCPDVPILLSMTYRWRRKDGELEALSGHAPQWFAAWAADWGVDALGVNCGRDLDMTEIIEIIRCYREHTNLPLFARPNAGTPKRVRDRWVYPHTPEAMAARLPELLEAGVSMVGGCCGTTPAHVAAFKPIVDAWNAANGLSDVISPA
jgi:5-methyltetrahydrofolate--homocysteine methyltransferase